MALLIILLCRKCINEINPKIQIGVVDLFVSQSHVEVIKLSYLRKTQRFV